LLGTEVVPAAAGYAAVAVVMPVVGDDLFYFGVPLLLMVPDASGLRCMAGA
jgi:hypothetical protein